MIKDINGTPIYYNLVELFNDKERGLIVMDTASEYQILVNIFCELISENPCKIKASNIQTYIDRYENRLSAKLARPVDYIRGFHNTKYVNFKQYTNRVYMSEIMKHCDNDYEVLKKKLHINLRKALNNKEEFFIEPLSKSPVGKICRIFQTCGYSGYYNKLYNGCIVRVGENSTVDIFSKKTFLPAALNKKMYNFDEDCFYKYKGRLKSFVDLSESVETLDRMFNTWSMI